MLSKNHKPGSQRLLAEDVLDGSHELLIQGSLLGGAVQHSVNGSNQLGVVGCSQTSGGIPSSRGREASGAALPAGLSALVVAHSHVVERSGIRLVRLVQQGVGKADLAAAVLHAVAVNQGEHSSEHGAGGGGAVNRLHLAVQLNVIGMAQGSDIGVATASRVEVAGGRGHTALGKVGLHDAVLVRGAGGVQGEASASGDQGTSAGGRSDLAAANGTLQLALADGGVASGLGIVTQLGGTHGGDVRGSSREAGVHLCAGARQVGAAVGTSVAGGGEQSHTSGAQLLEVGIHGVHEGLRAARRARSRSGGDLALVGLGPSVRHGHNVDAVCAVGQQVSGHLQHPPGGGVVVVGATLGDSTKVLHIQSGLSLGRELLEGTKVLIHRVGLGASVGNEGAQVGAGESSEVLELECSLDIASSRCAIQVVHALDGGGHHGQSGGVRSHLLQKSPRQVKNADRHMSNRR